MWICISLAVSAVSLLNRQLALLAGALREIHHHSKQASLWAGETAFHPFNLLRLRLGLGGSRNNRLNIIRLN